MISTDEGFFGDLFDFDGDGKLDAAEQAADGFALWQLLNSDTENGDSGEDSGNDGGFFDR